MQFVDDASLNQIEAAIEAELDAKAKELGVTFDYTLYNGQGDATTLNQIGAELVGKGVDLIVPIATPAVKIMQSATEDTEIPIVFSAVSDPVGSGHRSMHSTRPAAASPARATRSTPRACSI